MALLTDRRTSSNEYCTCGAIPEEDGKRQLEDPPTVVDHPIVDVHLAKVAEVVLPTQPLPGLLHPSKAEATPREEVLVGPAGTVEAGTELPNRHAVKI
jgi:hypothetical protein